VSIHFFYTKCTGQKTKSSEQNFFAAHFGESERLIQYMITAIVPGANGFLWVGTPGRLVRFNGNRFLPLLTKNTIQSKFNRITSI